MSTFTKRYIKCFLKTAQADDSDTRFYNDISRLKVINTENDDDNHVGILHRSWTLQGPVFLPKSLVAKYGDIKTIFIEEIKDTQTQDQIPVIADFKRMFWQGYDNVETDVSLLNINREPNNEDVWNVTLKVSTTVQLSGMMQD
jgi:hypothetical protein